jgi:hypothetical protein
MSSLAAGRIDVVLGTLIGGSARRDDAEGPIPFGPQSCVPGEHLVIAVVVKDRRLLPNRDGGDQAIDQFSDGGAPAAADAIQLGRRLEVRQPSQRQAWERHQPRSEPRALTAGSRPGKELHDDRLGCREGCASFEMMAEGDVSRVPGGPEQLDPG